MRALAAGLREHTSVCRETNNCLLTVRQLSVRGETVVCERRDSCLWTVTQLSVRAETVVSQERVSGVSAFLQSAIRCAILSCCETADRVVRHRTPLSHEHLIRKATGPPKPRAPLSVQQVFHQDVVPMRKYLITSSVDSGRAILGGMGVVGLVGMRPGGACLGSSQGLPPDPHTQVIAEQTQSLAGTRRPRLRRTAPRPRILAIAACGVPST